MWLTWLFQVCPIWLDNNRCQGEWRQDNWDWLANIVWSVPNFVCTPCACTKCMLYPCMQESGGVHRLTKIGKINLGTLMFKTHCGTQLLQHEIQLNFSFLFLLLFQQTEMGAANQVILVVTRDSVGQSIQKSCLVKPFTSWLSRFFLVSSLNIIGGQHVQRSDTIFFISRSVVTGRFFQQFNKFIITLFFVVENLKGLVMRRNEFWWLTANRTQ